MVSAQIFVEWMNEPWRETSPFNKSCFGLQSKVLLCVFFFNGQQLEIVPSGFKSGSSLWGFLKVAGQRFGYCDRQDSVPPECRFSKMFPGSRPLFYYHCQHLLSGLLLLANTSLLALITFLKASIAKLEPTD